MTSEVTTSSIESFISLGELLTRPRRGSSASVSTATLATAIEEGGVQGWDSYGRFVHFTRKDKGDKALHYQAALDALAREAAHEWSSQLDQFPTQTPAEEWAGCGTPFDRYGWRETELPDFARIAASAPSVPRRSPQVKRQENADLMLIGVMRSLMVKDTPVANLNMPKKRPPYDSQSVLIEEIVDIAEKNKLIGLSKATLSSKFAAANKALRDRETG